MMEQLDNLQDKIKESIKNAETLEALEEVRLAYLGKKGALTSILRGLRDIPPEDKPMAGKLANETKVLFENLFKEKKENLEKKLSEQQFSDDAFDVTLPGRSFHQGKLHPLTQVLEEILTVFTNLGFQVEEGPDVETEYYNFEGLNIGEYHPARDEWDSFYIQDNLLLRTHTSPVQLRVMEKQKPPLRAVAFGRCFRRDAVDRTHSHTFHQVEGFMVDKHISFGDLKGVLTLFARQLFGEDVRMRFRPDFFPFTEPSADGAITCFSCKGAGCRVCSETGWLEIFGCGMIHPRVLKRGNIDPKLWTGFAFGMGVERIAMLKYQIDDIRLFLENDIRFLKQF